MRTARTFGTDRRHHSGIRARYRLLIYELGFEKAENHSSFQKALERNKKNNDACVMRDLKLFHLQPVTAGALLPTLAPALACMPLRPPRPARAHRRRHTAAAWRLAVLTLCCLCLFAGSRMSTKKQGLPTEAATAPEQEPWAAKRARHGGKEPAAASTDTPRPRAGTTIESGGSSSRRSSVRPLHPRTSPSLIDPVVLSTQLPPHHSRAPAETRVVTRGLGRERGAHVGAPLMVARRAGADRGGCGGTVWWPG